MKPDQSGPEPLPYESKAPDHRPPDTRCAKCGCAMEAGFIPDQAQGGYLRAVWVAGPPEYSWWGSLKLRGRRRMYIYALRCTRCGYLEFYAAVPANQ